MVNKNALINVFICFLYLSLNKKKLVFRIPFSIFFIDNAVRIGKQKRKSIHIRKFQFLFDQYKIDNVNNCFHWINVNKMR